MALPTGIPNLFKLVRKAQLAPPICLGAQGDTHWLLTTRIITPPDNPNLLRFTRQSHFVLTSTAANFFNSRKVATDLCKAAHVSGAESGQACLAGAQRSWQSLLQERVGGTLKLHRQGVERLLLHRHRLLQTLHHLDQPLGRKKGRWLGLIYKWRRYVISIRVIFVVQLERSSIEAPWR